MDELRDELRFEPGFKESVQILAELTQFVDPQMNNAMEGVFANVAGMIRESLLNAGLQLPAGFPPPQ
jgi:hypothetical protein